MIPNTTTIEVPLLEALIEIGGEGRPRDIYPLVTKRFPKLSDEELKETVKDGKNRWTNRIQFARQSLVEKGQIDRSVKGIWKITDKGITRVKTPEVEKPRSDHRRAIDKWANDERAKLGTLRPSTEVLTTKVDLNQALPEDIWLDHNGKEIDGLSRFKIGDQPVYQCALEVHDRGSKEDLCVRVSIILPYVTRFDIICDADIVPKITEFLNRLCDPNIVKTRVKFYDLKNFLNPQRRVRA